MTDFNEALKKATSLAKQIFIGFAKRCNDQQLAEVLKQPVNDLMDQIAVEAVLEEIRNRSDKKSSSNE